MKSIPRSSGIYAIICTLTGKCYIGSAVNLRERQSQHFSEMRRGIHFNEHLRRAVTKYGIENFIFKIIEECERNRLQEREQYYLDWLQPFDERGFNIVPIVNSAMKGRKHKPDTYTKEVRAKMSVTKKGKKLSPEHVEKLRIAHTGICHTSESREKMSHSHWRQYVYIVTTPEGIEMTIKNLYRFCKDQGLNAGHMGEVSRGDRNHHKGWKVKRIK